MLFPNYSVEAKTILCITRSADINPDDELYENSEDYREHMKQIVKLRRRLKPVRIECYGKQEPEIVEYLREKLEFDGDDIFCSQTPLQLKYVYELGDFVSKEVRRKESYLPFEPALNRDLIPGESITKQVEKEDKLLSFPFDSMDPFVELLKESSKDPETVSIKITIYRLAKRAKIVQYLCDAAERGKEVVVLMELRARFDEENNINYSEILEEAGCKILYGAEEYKVHSKICLITRKTGNGISYITQIGTGNYNESTSKIFTDLSLLTASKEIGKDAAMFFHNMAVYNLDGEYQHLRTALPD
jgi:polyphosphate kinase